MGGAAVVAVTASAAVTASPAATAAARTTERLTKLNMGREAPLTGVVGGDCAQPFQPNRTGHDQPRRHPRAGAGHGHGNTYRMWLL